MKTVALHDIHGKIPNLALMKLGAYYEQKGYAPVLCKNKETSPPQATRHYASCVKFMKNLRFIDRLGRGLPMVWQEMKRIGGEAVFKEIGKIFKVTIRWP